MQPAHPHSRRGLGMTRHLQLPVRWRSYGGVPASPFAPTLFAVLFGLFWLPASRFDRRQTPMRSKAQETVTP
jgi:hypothetical protein